MLIKLDKSPRSKAPVVECTAQVEPRNQTLAISDKYHIFNPIPQIPHLEA